MKKQIILLMLVLVSGMVRLAVAEEPIGVFANNNTNCIQLINPATHEASPSFLKGSLGSYGGGLFDVEITPDGKTAIVSNFGNSKIYFIDISGGFSAQPTILGRTNVGIFAEDLAVTPDGKYVLVTDGGFSSSISVIDVATHQMVSCQNFPDENSISIEVFTGPDGKLYVITTDYDTGKVRLYMMKENGKLKHLRTRHLYGAYLENIAISSDGKTAKIKPLHPVNISISPDGKTAITANASEYYAAAFAITANDIVFTGLVPLPTKSGQSCVFSKDGAKAYYLSNSVINRAIVHVLNVTGPGQVSYSGISIPIRPKRGTSQLFGVDTIAIDPSGNYLYVANPTVSGGTQRISIIDLTINQQVNYIQANGIPTGIKFATIAD